MSDQWKPERYTKDEVANAIYNLAASANQMAMAMYKLFYALKFSDVEGPTVSEAIVIAARERNEVADNGVDDAIDRLGDELAAGLEKLARAQGGRDET